MESWNPWKSPRLEIPGLWMTPRLTPPQLKSLDIAFSKSPVTAQRDGLETHVKTVQPIPGSGPKLEISSLKPLGTLLHWLLLKLKSKQEPPKLSSVQKNTLPLASYTGNDTVAS